MIFRNELYTSCKNSINKKKNVNDLKIFKKCILLKYCKKVYLKYTRKRYSYYNRAWILKH